MKHVFLCDLTHTGQRIASDCFPYGIGCLAAYLERNFPSPISAHLFKFPGEIYSALVNYRPRIIGFANYVWNLHLSKTLAEHIKALFPETVIVFGGPNFPKSKDDQEEFLRACRVIDFYIEGEGELAFLELVKTLFEHDFDLEAVKQNGSPSVRTILDGEFFAFDLTPRFKSIDHVPSPYLAGKLDKFFSRNLMPLIQTNRGCPFSCTYCVEGHSYYNKVAKRHDRSVIAEEMAYIAKRAMDNKQLFIADSNFGMYPEDVKTAKVIRQTMDTSDYPAYIHVATGKNQKNRVLEVARILKGRLRLSGSVQTLDPVVVSNIKRENISIKQLLDLAKGSWEVGANSYSEIILGLPGDSLDAHMRSMKGVIEAGFNFVLPFTLMLLMGSDLFQRDNDERFSVQRKYRVLPRCFGFYSFGDKTFLSGEVEEVCVSNRTMSVDDYLECRIFTLTVALFFNDRIFEEVLETLKSLNLSTYEWLSIIHGSRERSPEKLERLYQDFKKATLGELWDSREELMQFICRPKNMKRYISGELGFNVLFNYRAEALATMMRELNDVAFASAIELISRKCPEVYNRDKDYLEQLKIFSLLRKDRLFDSHYTPEASFDYDFQRILEERLWELRNRGRAGGQYTYRFYQMPEQVKMAEKQMRVFGSDQAGLAKVLSRIPISKMYRHTARTKLAS